MAPKPASQPPPEENSLPLPLATYAVIENAFVSLPAEFVALIVKLNVPAVVGVPEITPVVPFMLKPLGKLPLSSDQVIGVVPVALSAWLYAAPAVPPGREEVTIPGATPEELITMVRILVSLAQAFVVLIEKVNVPALVGVPKITPPLFRYKPSGRGAPGSTAQFSTGPWALSAWLYNTPSVPAGRDVVVIFEGPWMTMVKSLVDPM